jgi:hypothetical protein
VIDSSAERLLGRHAHSSHRPGARDARCGVTGECQSGGGAEVGQYRVAILKDVLGKCRGELPPALRVR